MNAVRFSIRKKRKPRCPRVTGVRLTHADFHDQIRVGIGVFIGKRRFENGKEMKMRKITQNMYKLLTRSDLTFQMLVDF